MLGKVRFIGNIVYWVVVALLLFVVAGTVLSVREAPGGYRMFVVMSGSMEPDIKVGSVVLVRNTGDYKEEDIVTYLRNQTDSSRDIESTVTHRIIGIEPLAGEEGYRTKGDANETHDLELVTKSQILGKVILAIPFVGQLVAFSKTQVGFTLFIVIPTVLIVYHEVLNIKGEIEKFLEKRLSKNKKGKKDEENKPKKK